MKKVIVYGLGNYFEENKEFIFENYEVVGFSDKDKVKLKNLENAIEVAELTTNLNCCDFVLIATNTYFEEICNDLLSLKVPWEKIHFLVHDILFTEKKFVSHSQYGEDLFLNLAVKMLYKNPSTIKYVEIGTNHPINANNSYLLYKAFGGGVLIDPFPFLKYQCKVYRANDVFLQMAVSGKENAKEISFYVCEESSALSSLSRETIKATSNVLNIDTHSTEIKVEMIAINDLFEKIGFCPEILLIDAEGEDENIIRSIDYKKYKPDITMAELGSINLSEFMQNNGYVMIMHNSVNTIF